MSASLAYPTKREITLNKLFTAILRRAANLVFVLMLGAIIAHGQKMTSATDYMTPLALTPGAPVGSRIEDIANVNLFNGNLNFAMTLATVEGHGSLRVPLTLTIERHWKVLFRCDPTPTGGTVCHQIPTSMGWGELQVGYGPGILQGRGGVQYEMLPRGGYVCSNPGGKTTLTFTDPSGTERELRDQLTNGALAYDKCAMERGTVFRSVDGTSMTFVSDIHINDDQKGGPIARPNGYLMLDDGTRQRIDNGLVTWIRDRNGNRIDYTYDEKFRVRTITDSLNRQVTINHDVTDSLYGLHDQIVLLGVGGVKRVVRVCKAPLRNALRSDQVIQKYGQLFSSAYNYDTEFNPTVITSVYLPNDQSYNFSYNSYGELARIKLPSGGAVEYDFTGGLANGPVSGGIVLGNSIYRRVVTKRTYTDSSEPGSLTSKTTYTRPESADSQNKIYTVGYVQVDTRGAGDKLLARTKHYFYGAAAESLTSKNPYSPWKYGKEYQTELFDDDGLTVLKRTTQTWQQRAQVSWYAAYTNLNGWGPDNEPANDPRVIETTLVLEPTGANLVTKQKFKYDELNNQTDVYEYDYGIGTEPPHPIRHIHTDYLIVNPTNNINYAEPANGASYTPNDPHILRMPRAQQFYAINPATGAEIPVPVSQNETRYDEYSLLDCDGVGCSGVVRWDNPGVARANVTSVRRWLNTNDTWIENHIEYDQLGNARKLWDGRANRSDAEQAMQIEYAAAYHHAYPTHTTSPAPDPSNVNGTNSPLESWTTYDLSTGKVTARTDTNGKTTTLRYDENGKPDALDRLRRVETSDGGSIGYFYNDTVGDLYVRTRTAMNGAQSLESYQFFDNLGRSVRSFLNEGGGLASFITKDTQYDALGRVSRISNAYRTNGLADPVNPSGLWTTMDYDTLGRVRTVTTPDGAKMATTYTGNQVTLTDQAGKQRRSITDALGRLKQVFEAPGDVNFNYQTSYEYDVLGNLKTVTQGAQTRIFVYDSLSRLSSAFHPESGTANYHYDNNSNLEWKTDARGVKTSYEYDALNRVKTRTYSLTGTPPPNYVATPPVNYFYDGKGMPANVPTPAFSNGKLTAVKTSISETIYTEFDSHGNIKKHRQVSEPGTSNEQTYLMEYSYDLFGNMISQKYPSGKIVETEYDAAGRIAGVKNSIGRYYAGAGLEPADEANRIQYSAHGSVSDLRLGNGLWEHTIFNHRLQATEIGLGTQKGSNDRLKLAYGYGMTNNNGNVQNQTITVPTVNGVTGVTLTQTYGYDQLNRLQSASESGGADNWTQGYTYKNPDGTGGRFGNRRIDPSNTTQSLIPVSNPTFNIDNNRFAASQGYDYDAVGNLKTVPGNSYLYDSENRMVSANDGQSFGVSNYSYDGDGRRVKKVTGTGAITTIFVYNSMGKLVAEYTNNPSPTNGGGTNYLTSDNLGSPRIITDSNGAVKARHDYLPFGEEIAAGTGGRTANQGYSTSDGLRQGYTGYEKDAETGLNYAQARYQSPAQGRFTSPDPLMGSARAAEPQTWNRYAYCGNNPLNRIDPSGLDWWYDSEERGRQTPRWFDRDPGGKWRRWDSTFSFVYQDATTGLWVALDPDAGRAYVNKSKQRVEAAFEIFIGGKKGLFSNTGGELDFIAGYSAGISPGSVFLTFWHEANGIDTTSRDYAWGLGAGTLVTFGLGSADDVVTITISASKHPESAAHILEAQAAGYPGILTLDRAGATARRAESLSGIPKIGGSQLDEYPPAMFMENRGSAAVRPISPSDNMGAGAAMGNQLRSVPNGARVRIVVVP